MIPKSLKEVCKLPLLQLRNSNEIQKLWFQHHETLLKTSASVVSKDEYFNFLNNLKKYPNFLVPLKRGEGIENFVIQKGENTKAKFRSLDDMLKKNTSLEDVKIFVTSLEEFKMKIENAQPM